MSGRKAATMARTGGGGGNADAEQLRRELEDARARIKELEAEIAKIKGEGGPNGGSTSSGYGAPSAVPSAGSYGGASKSSYNAPPPAAPAGGYGSSSKSYGGSSSSYGGSSSGYGGSSGGYGGASKSSYNAPPPAAPSGGYGTPPPVPNSGFNAAPAQKQCRALYAYNAMQPGDLSFKAGDIITIVEKSSNDWWEGELNGVRGQMPANYVQEL